MEVFLSMRYMWWGPEGFMASSQFTCCKSFKNTVIIKIPNILYCTINLHLDAPEDITDGIIDNGSTIKRLYFYLWNFTTQLLLAENRVYVKDINEILKLKCVQFSFSYVHKNTNFCQWFTLGTWFYSDKSSSGRKEEIKTI